MTPEYIAELLLLAVNQIAEEPQLWNQQYWIQTFNGIDDNSTYLSSRHFNEIVPVQAEPFCGTTCCLGGWMFVMADDGSTSTANVDQIMTFVKILRYANDLRWERAFSSLFYYYKYYWKATEMFDLLVSLKDKTVPEIMQWLDEIEKIAVKWEKDQMRQFAALIRSCWPMYISTEATNT